MRCPSLAPVGAGSRIQVQCDGPTGHIGLHKLHTSTCVYAWTDELSADGAQRSFDQVTAWLRGERLGHQHNIALGFDDASIYGDAVATPADMRLVVQGQLADIHDALPDDWHGHLEIEPIPPELTDTYDVAHGSAVRNCDHSRSSHSTMLSRGERQCDECGRYFKRRSFFDL